MKKAIIFDLDGTLWDSSETVADSWNEVIASFGGRELLTADGMKKLMGKPMDEIAEIVFAGVDADRSMLMEKCCEKEHEYVRRLGGRLYDNLEQQLAEMRAAGFELYIVSNCQLGYIDAFLDCYTSLRQYFDDTECWGNTGLQKDENIRLVMERRSVDRAVYVGDTQRDCDSAKGAGVPFIHAAYGFGEVEPGHAAAYSFEDILPLALKLTEE